jgi:hypothetical protein
MVRTKKQSADALANRGHAFKHLSILRKACINIYGVFPGATVRNYPLLVEVILKTKKIVKLSYNLTSKKVSYVDLDSNYLPVGKVTIKDY